MKWIKVILHRLLDITVSCAALALLTPVFAAACACAIVGHVPVLLHKRAEGSDGRSFNRFYFSRMRRMASLPVLFNILRGDMTIDINIDINITSR